MKFSRRFLLKSMGLGTGAWFLSPTLVRNTVANPRGSDRFFIFCYFGGGWDQLLALDPRDPGKFSDSRIRETKIQLGYDRLEEPFSKDLIMPSGSKIEYGPAAAPIAKHFDKSCVVRGVAMDTVSHNVGRRYFITGMMPRGQNAVGSSLPTWLVSEQGEHSPVPNLVVGVETYNRKLPAYASGLRVGNVSDLLSTLSDGPQSPKDKIREMIEVYREQNDNCDPASLDRDGLFQVIRSSQQSARVMVSKNLSRHFNFMGGSDEMKEIRSRYVFNSMNSGAAQAAMAFQALRQGVAQSVTIQLTGGLDTHGDNWNTTQPERLHEGFRALSVLVDDLEKTPHPFSEGKTMMDTTTIMCFSEFARTPMLNNGGGRDHWLASSALLMGAGVPHNKVVGATTDTGMNPSAINPNTGEVDKSGLIITPTRIAASLMESAGYSPDAFRVSGLPCLKAEG
ncbi:MAG: DUF1501 domain-containing protein [Deltaproteobacteria bacterium]|nr:MAG: DUF1501 domain-containing protein [Deltaproteobacteria bacterium]